MSVFEDQPERLPELFQAVADRAMPSPRLLLGITGAPGSGKSTLTDAMVTEYRRRYPDRRVGVIAVDPSSPFSGGAVLGDRVRMMRHATDPMVFVRSLASRGHLGGLALGVKGVIRVMALIGCDVVFVETVGVGQSEVEIARVADRVMIVLAPGQGDSVQLLKAGLMEIGDIFAVNKADNPGAEQLYTQILAAMQLERVEASCGPHHQVGVPGEALVKVEPDTPVKLVSATTGQGVPELVDVLEKLTAAEAQQWQAQRDRAVQAEVAEAVLEEARRRLLRGLGSNGALGAHVQRVMAGEVSVPALAQELIERTAQNFDGNNASRR